MVAESHDGEVRTSDRGAEGIRRLAASRVLLVSIVIRLSVYSGEEEKRVYEMGEA